MAPLDAPGLRDLLAHLEEARAVDFQGYKRPTLERRIAKRLEAVGVPDYAAYVDYLQAHPAEFDELFATILINVTAFFRDGAPWELLRTTVLPELVGRRPTGQIRAWCAGCASGEEAYTLAALLVEACGEERFREDVKIYATDVDEDALREARLGAYPLAAVDAVPDDLRARCFVRTAVEATFRPELRRSVIFGRHDLLRDPPISRIDVLTCRNTLMYMNAEAQTRILRQFGYAMADGGYLMLGKSEFILSRSGGFAPVDLRSRIFRRVGAPPPVDDPDAVQPERAPAAPAEDRLLLAAFAHSPVAQLVVDRAGTVRQANERARVLFGIPPDAVGRALQELELSYRPVELRSRIDAIYDDPRPLRLSGIHWRVDDRDLTLDVSFSPLASARGETAGVAIAFDDVSAFRRLEDDLRISKSELEAAYEELQSTVEELETTNEELQSTNEELETTNEELQSTNEELETMNEELQSTNEELQTINDELRLRTEQLDRLNGVLESIMAGLDAAIVVVDRNLHVEVWNDAATDLWGLREDEVVGQAFLNLDIGLPVVGLKPELLRCLAGDTPRQDIRLEARNRRGRTFGCQVRITPLRVEAGRTTGAILVLIEEVRDASLI